MPFFVGFGWGSDVPSITQYRDCHFLLSDISISLDGYPPTSTIEIYLEVTLMKAIGATRSKSSLMTVRVGFYGFHFLLTLLKEDVSKTE
jgi:hypothetical protein